MARTKTYQHFCPVARSLEVIGEKWSLLIVRDLLRGPRRFTDLHNGLGKITAKWLTLRLRDLEAAGIVERDREEGRREVWYRLSPKGRELAPVIGALNLWGVRHALRAPEPDENVSPGAIIGSAAGFLQTARVHLDGPRRWLFDIEGASLFAIEYDGRRWSSNRPEESSEASVVIRGTARALAAFYAARGNSRRAAMDDLEVEGPETEQQVFIDALDGNSMPVRAAPG